MFIILIGCYENKPVNQGIEVLPKSGYAAIIQTDEMESIHKPKIKCEKWFKQPITNRFKCVIFYNTTM